MERDGKDSTRVLATKVIKKMWKLVWRAGPVITLLLLLWQSFILRDQIILTREQLKSTQESIHAQTHQEMMKDVLQMNSGIASHPNLARRLSDDIEPTWSDTTIDEAFVIFNILIYYENVWYQHEHRTITDDVWETWQVFMIEIIRKPEPQLIWKKTLRYFNPGFNNWISTQIAARDSSGLEHIIG